MVWYALGYREWLAGRSLTLPVFRAGVRGQLAVTLGCCTPGFGGGGGCCCALPIDLGGVRGRGFRGAGMRRGCGYPPSPSPPPPKLMTNYELRNSADQKKGPPRGSQGRGGGGGA